MFFINYYLSYFHVVINGQKYNINVSLVMIVELLFIKLILTSFLLIIIFQDFL